MTTYAELIDDATYRCYCYNRKRAPDITPEQWQGLFPKALEYELRKEAIT